MRSKFKLHFKLILSSYNFQFIFQTAETIKEDYTAEDFEND